jgi:hypothetical protein
VLRLLGVMALGFATLAITTNAGFARVGGRAIGNPTIDKVVFGGSPANPGITVVGSDLNYDPSDGTSAPTPSPPFTPGGHPGCPPTFKGPQGYDFGTRLYLVDKSADPTWAAGRYRPGSGELDCIGLVIEQWNSGAIQFHFGSFYRIGHFHLNPGDYVQIVFNHLTTGVHVKYGPDGVTS